MAGWDQISKGSDNYMRDPDMSGMNVVSKDRDTERS